MSDTYLSAEDLPEEELEYSYGPHPDDPKRMGIHLTTGKFAGFFVSFNYVKVDVDEVSEDISLKFDYDILGMPKGTRKKEYIDNPELHETMSRIAFDEYLNILRKKDLQDNSDVV